MQFKDIFQEVTKIKKSKEQKLLTDTDLQLEVNTLLERVFKSYQEKGFTLIKEILANMSLHNSIEDQTIALIPDCKLEAYPVNKELYNQLLPLCRLAYLDECNGNPEEHSYKLSIIFNDFTSAWNYLLTFPKFNTVEYLIHDACLFDLPVPKPRHFNQWQLLAKKNMINPRFRCLLAHTDALEKIAKLAKNGRQCMEQNRPNIEKTKKVLIGITAEYNRLYSHGLNFPTETLVHQRNQKLAHLKIQQSELRIAFAVLRQGLSVSELDLLVLESYL